MFQLMQHLPSIIYQGILQAYWEKLAESAENGENIPHQVQTTLFFKDLLSYKIACILSPISIQTNMKK